MLSPRFAHCRPLRVLIIVATMLIGAVANAELQSDEVLFERDVMAVLSKAGCNSGPCHGNINGKGDLRLSLRGQDARRDYLAITHELGGRRIDRVSPTESLILKKPTAESPHQGGQRFKVDSIEYRILLAWLRNGMLAPSEKTPAVSRLIVAPDKRVLVAPANQVQLTVIAEYADGTRRDVTRLATYDVSNYVVEVSKSGLVSALTFGEATVVVRYLQMQVPVSLAFLPDRSFDWKRPEVNNYVDSFVHAKLRSLRLNPEPTCGDSQFVRRVHLDLLGLIPTAKEAQSFVGDRSPNKRQRLVDDLLARPEFADHWAQKWCDLLRVEERVLDPRGVEVFHGWIRQCFADGLPLNDFAKQLVEAEGSTYETPPANLYRALRDPLERGEAIARVFLGVRLQCAKCHNHPFDQWTQDDYYSWAACFAQVDYKIVENKRKDRLDKNEFNGEQIVIRNAEKSVKNARTDKVAMAKLLDHKRQAVSPSAQRDSSARVADWLAEDNVAFAKAQVNRIWFHLMGRGLVEPVDDFRVTNPASHPKLLEALAREFINADFDVRTIIRRIVASRSYQTGSSAADPSELQLTNYAVNRITRLSAEQLLDAQCHFLDVSPEFNGFEVGMRAGQLPGVHKINPRREKPSRDDRFLMVFGKPERLMTCECERTDETTLSQVFMLISDGTVQKRLESNDGPIELLLKKGLSPMEIVSHLYWDALSRAPSTAEVQQIGQLLSRKDGDIPATKMILQDLGWALMNSKEFVFRN